MWVCAPCYEGKPHRNPATSTCWGGKWAHSFLKLLAVVLRSLRTQQLSVDSPNWNKITVSFALLWLQKYLISVYALQYVQIPIYRDLDYGKLFGKNRSDFLRQFRGVAVRGRQVRAALEKCCVEMNKAPCSPLNNKNTHPHAGTPWGLYYQLSHTVVLLAFIQD